MQRYFVKEKQNDTFTINKEDSYHIKTVMRMNIKDKIEIIYNKELYICEITNLNTNVECKIVEKQETKEKKNPKVIIAQALVKEQKMDYILQKCTELGVEEIIPIKTERSIIDIKEKDEQKKIERWKKVLKEASEQSKRTNIPTLNKILNIKELDKIECKQKCICSVNEKTKTIKSVLSNINNSDTIIFVIGPEGGFSNKEEEMLEKYGFQSISLGNNVLRTETASSYILSVVNYEFM